MRVGDSAMQNPSLPHQYRLVHHGTVANLLDAAQCEAQAGAEEGTLLWADSQSAATGRSGDRWEALPGGLYGALILRPEHPLPQVLQLAYVGLTSLGFAVAELWPAMATLRYRWPNDLLLNASKAGAVWLRYPRTSSGPPPWLALGVALDAPEAEIAAEADIDPAIVLEHFSRHFLAQINRWAEQGFEPLRTQFLERAEGRNEWLTVRVGEGITEGRFTDLDDSGNLVFDDGRAVELATVFPPVRMQ